MKSTQSKQASDFLLFEHFIDYLQQQGFVIGVDTHVRIKALLNKMDEPLSGDRFKYLLCPLLAHDLDQQAIFYQSYDYFFGDNGLKNQALAPTKKAASPSSLKLVTPKRPSRLFYLFVTFLLVIGMSLTGLYYLNSSPTTDDSVMLDEGFDWGNDFLDRDSTDLGIENFLNISEDSPEDYAPVDESLHTGEQEVTLTDWIQKYLPYLKWLLIGLLVLGWLLYEWFRYQRRKLFLHQQHLQQAPSQLRPILLEKHNKAPHDPNELHQSATMMRRRQKSEAAVLDLPKTIKATIEASGYPSFKYKAGTRTSEYLVLIDQNSEDDHLAALFHQLMDELAHLDIFLDTYYYSDDPRICWKSKTGNQYYLESLYYKYPHHRLLIVGDVQAFVDTVTDTLPEWFDTVELWQDKAILSTRPTDQWDECEFTLSKYINLLPAILPSIALLIEQFEQEAAPNLTMWIAKNYLLLQPNLDYAFKEAPNLRQTPYTSEQVHEQCESVRAYLGEEVFQWLCACAVYPQLKWDLTLSLGRLLDKDGTLLQPNNLLRLARLEWFRTGQLPAITRSHLAGQLNKENETIVSEHFTRYLEKTAVSKDAITEQQTLSNIAILHPMRRAGRFMKNLILRRELPDPLQKGEAYVSMQSVETVKRWMFGLQLPKFIQSLFYRKGMPLLGMRTGVRATGVLLSIAFIMWLMQPPAESEAEVKQAVAQGVQDFMDTKYDQSFETLYNYHESDYFDPYAKYLLGEILFHGLGYQDKDLELAGQFFGEAAESGVAEAMIYKGFYHANGIGNNKNPEVADAWFDKGRKKLLEPENIQRTTGLYMLGLSSKAGYGTPTDYAEALEWFKKAGYANYGPAQNEAGLMYQYGRGTDKSESDAFKWFGQSAQNGFAPGQNNLAWCYHQGLGVEKDYKKAIEWYVKALRQGYTESKRELDYLFDRVLALDGYGPETVKWYKEVAEHGYAPAQNSIGYIYDNGIGVPEDDREAFGWYRKAAEQGYIMAQNNLGYMYRNGLGTEKNVEQAYRWYHAAAEQGYPPAQNNLGFLLDQGIGVKENDKEAFRWYQSAANQGHADACYNVAMMYRYGMGTPLDKVQAFMWYSRSADQGNAMAQYELGFMYEKGVGVDMNYTRAREWYVYSSIQGNPKAKDALERLNSTFFDDDLELDEDKLNRFFKSSDLGE